MPPSPSSFAGGVMSPIQQLLHGANVEAVEKVSFSKKIKAKTAFFH
jgi:hypothetical protein